jgi:5-methylcytosine-specific restriction endonuclease McrA
MLKDGRPPTGYQVHHIVPLAMGGTNAQDNLILLNDNPQHRAITGAQKTLTAGNGR